MTEQIKTIIQSLNSNQSGELDTLDGMTPIDAVVRILNNQLTSLMWIDEKKEHKLLISPHYQHKIGEVQVYKEMDEQDDMLASDTGEQMLPPRSIGRKNQSIVWDHFDKVPAPNPLMQAKCKHCDALIKYGSGTSAMHTHLSRCKSNPDNGSKKQKSDSSTTAISSHSLPKIDQEACRNALIKMFVAMELSFRMVEHEAFREFLSIVAPFLVISRTTLARDVLKLWSSEKVKLKNFLSQHCHRVCLTTDTWTSSQNLNYMSLTAQFIDNDWKLQKKVINFCQVSSHTGKNLALTVENCLSSWGLTRVLTLTVDNASSNDKAIEYLHKRLMSWNRLALSGDYLHTCCCAHIINLIVQEGFKEDIDAICKIRAAVKYVRSSPSRLATFKDCVAQENIEYKGLVCLDVETRWNSTYLMLEAALKHQKAFEEYELRDKKYLNIAPSYSDWEFVRSILPFLKLFHDATVRISGSAYVTSTMYMFEAFGIGRKIKQMSTSRDVNVSVRMMAGRMKEKYDRYWGNPDRLNMLLMIALVLHPRYKLKFTNWLIAQSFDGEMGEVTCKLKDKVESSLRSLFEEYNGGGNEFEARSQEAQLSEGGSNDDPYGFNQFFRSTGSNKSELDKYLDEALEESQGDLDVLNWWKLNSGRFPTLANMARDVLAIPVSTVASESAFSTGGRVLDPYRSSLTPKMVEALVCTQDWIKRSPSPLPSNDNEEFLEFERVEEEIVPSLDISYPASSIFTLDDD